MSYFNRPLIKISDFVDKKKIDESLEFTHQALENVTRTITLPFFNDDLLNYTKNFMLREPCKNATLFLNSTTTKLVQCASDEILGNGYSMVLSYILTNVRQWSSDLEVNQDNLHLNSIKKGMKILSSNEFEKIERIFHEVNNGVVDLQGKIGSVITSHFSSLLSQTQLILIGLVLNTIIVCGFLILIVVRRLKRQLLTKKTIVSLIPLSIVLSNTGLKEKYLKNSGE